MRPVDETDHVRGFKHAPLTLVEYADYECPYCRQAQKIVTKLQEVFGGNLRVVFRNFPLRSIHPHAELAAEAAEAAAAQGRFWEMHDSLYEDQSELEFEDLTKRAEIFELDLDRFQEDLENQAYSKRISDDFRDGVRSGVNGTPAFFINGARYTGSWDFEPLSNELQRVLDRELIHRAI